MAELGRILIADDEESFLLSTAELLRDEGYECVCASDARIATAMLDKEGYDLLIADIKMPGNSDLEFIKELPRMVKGMPVILVTGYPSLSSAIQSIPLPVIAYLIKPFEFSELLAQVEHWCKTDDLLGQIRKMRDELEIGNRQLSALYAVTATASSSLDLDTILQEVVKRTTEVFHFNSTRIYLLNPDEDELLLKAFLETQAGLFAQDRSCRLGQGIIGRVAETGELLIMENIQNDPQYDRLSVNKRAQIAGFSFFAVFPIKSKLKTVGTIVCIGKDPRRLTADEIQLIASMSNQIGVAVENAQLYEKTKRQASQLEMDIVERQKVEEELRSFTERLGILHEIDQTILAARSPEEIAHAATRHLRQLVPYWRATIVSFNIEMDTATVLATNVSGKTRIKTGASFALKEFLGFEAMRQGKVYAVEDIPTLSEQTKNFQALYAEGLRSYVNIPLISHAELIGSLNLGFDSPRAFIEEHIQVAKEIADSLAVAIQNAQLFEQVQAGREQMQLLSRRLVVSQEVERHAIARELHDEIGQLLTGLKLTLEGTRHLPADKYQERLNEAQGLINELMTRVRGLSLDLRPAMLDDLGLLPALLWLFERHTAQTNVKINFEHAGIQGRRFLSEVETATYRILQEALTNIARHTGVSEATVQVRADKRTLNLQIEDHGKGFDPKATVNAGSGLAGMRERAMSLNGQLTIESSPGAGTRLTVTLPLGQTKAKRE